MPVTEELLKILVCPEDKSELQRADQGLVERLNQRIAAGALKNRGGELVKEKIDAGLVRADGRYLYPIREDIPIMLIDEAIEIAGL